MKFSQLYFGKDLNQILLKDIETFFNIEKEESDKIEFKSFHSKAKESDSLYGIQKTIAGFLNSEGGLLIWGAPVGKPHNNNPKKKVFKGDLTPVATEYDKDSIISKIVSSFTPLPIGILFHTIKGNSGFIYLFEISKSAYSPHQFDNRYFMRLDGQTIPAPHHYVEALMKRISFPKLKGFIRVESFNTMENYDKKFMMYLTIEYGITNLSPFQNERDIFLKSEINGGKFNDAKYGLIPIYQSLTEILVQPAKQLLCYGDHYILKANVEILDYKNEKELFVTMYFGGRNSPLIRHEVVIDLTKTINREMVTVLRNNKYVYDLMEEVRQTFSEHIDTEEGDD